MSGADGKFAWPVVWSLLVQSAALQDLSKLGVQWKIHAELVCPTDIALRIMQLARQTSRQLLTPGENKP